MAKIEIEQRGLLSESQFRELDKKLSSEGKFLGEKKRFSVISASSQKSVKEVVDEKIDLRVRVTNGKSELVLKYGKWGSKDSRREINIAFDTKDFDEMIEFIKLIGFNRIVLQATVTRCYTYNNIEFALVHVPGYGYYFEAEIMADDNESEDAHKAIESEVGRLGLRIANQEEYHELLDSMNNREGFRLDLDKTDFQETRKRFAEYFDSNLLEATL